MLAGMLAQSGYYMGSQPLAVNFAPPAERQTNPKGNFEDVEINAINEEIIAPLYPRWPRTRIGQAIQARRVLAPGLRWAADLPPDIVVSADADLATRMREQTAHTPFCFKDPRFAYTLPAWRPHVGDAAFVCVFRHPARTVNSILTEWGRHSRSYEMTRTRALAAWRCPYLQILTRHCHDGDWLFLHYDQILDGSAVPRIEMFLGAIADSSFPEPALKRSSAEGEIGPVERDIYLELCNRAGYRDRATALSRDS